MEVVFSTFYYYSTTCITSSLTPADNVDDCALALVAPQGAENSYDLSLLQLGRVPERGRSGLVAVAVNLHPHARGHAVGYSHMRLFFVCSPSLSQIRLATVVV